MAQISYTNTITDASHFDATFIMQNYNNVINQVNGNLDEDNVKSASKLSIASLIVDDGILPIAIEPPGSLTIKNEENYDFLIRGAEANILLKCDETGVTIGA